MGLFEYGGNFKLRGGNDLTYPIGGTLPNFASTGSTQYYYYAVINDTTTSTSSAPYLFGQAASNGSGNITLTWPCVTNGAHTMTYDILRKTGTSAGNTFIPFGTGNYKVITGVVQAVGAVCTATDTNAAPGSYTVALQSYQPTFILQGQTAPGGQAMEFWPGGTILTGGAIAFIDDYAPNASNGGYFVSTAASTAGGNIATYPTVFADKCEAAPFAGSPIYAVCPANGGGEGVAGTALNATILGFGVGASGAGGTENNLKGRLIFEKGPGTNYFGPTHWITLGDSNPAKTAAYGTSRPPNDPNDVWIGLDPTASVALTLVPLAFGSPVSISNYIGNVGDGTSWQERLTTNTKTFNVNTVVNGNFTVTGTCTGCTNNGLQFIFGNAGPSITALTIPNGDSLTFSGTGTNNASSINGVTVTGTPSVGWVPTATSGTTATWQATGSGTAFSAITSSTNTTAAMLCGTGCSLGVSGSGTNNATTLLANTWAIPGTIGSTTPNTAAFTTLSASSTVSGAGFSAYLASPPAIGGSAAAAGTFTALLASTSITDSALLPAIASKRAQRDCLLLRAEHAGRVGAECRVCTDQPGLSLHSLFQVATV